MGLYKHEGSIIIHNPKVDYICWCKKCYDSYGIRNQYGMDEYCPKCGEPLDWENDEKEW